MSALALDRIAPTRRPEGANSGTQRWRDLLFLHWSFEPDVVRRLVPAGLELDLWQGRAWVGLVPFKMEATKPSWLPRVAALDFLETNLRTYVHREGAPGVYFFSLEASAWLAVRAARIGWGLPYFHAEMTFSREESRIVYRSRRRDGSAKPRLDITCDVGDELGPSTPGSLEHFLLERYLLFVSRGGKIRRGQVHHGPYPARRANVVEIHDELVSAAGLPEARRFETAHWSSGVDVEVFALR